MQIKTPIQITDEGVMYNIPVRDDIELLFADLPKEHQYWRRQTDFPKFFYDYNPHLPEKDRCRLNAAKTNYRGDKLASLSVEDTIELTRLVKREKDRMTNGIYLMINGEMQYWPGVYYGVLQWCKMFGQKGNDGYGEHREYQQNLAYVHDLAVTDDDEDGYYCHKAKKTGITMEVTLFILVSTIIFSGFTAAAMSKVFDTAKKANFKYYLYALKNLPHVLRPKIEQKGWQNAVQKVEMKCSDPEFSAENVFVVVSTTTDGLDGMPVIQIIHIDEPPKFPSGVPIEQVYTKSKEQCRTQHVKQGIIIMTSYPPEEDTDAFKWCREFYSQCCKLNPDTKKPYNKMIAIFIGVLESSNGTFDKYGKPDRQKAFHQEMAERAKCKNDAELQARQRQYPMTAKEGWQSGGSGSVYNNIILSEREAQIEDELNAGVRNYIEGNLEWTAGRFSKVRFVPLTHEQIMKGKTGKWRFYKPMEWIEANSNLCFEMPRRIKYMNGERHYLLQPPNHVVAVGGLDPVDYAYVSEMGKERSTNASVTKDIEGNMICVYYDRDENPDVNIDDVCMEIIFLSKYTMIEGNRKNMFTTVENQGLHYFLLVTHPTGEIKPYSEKVSIKPVSSGKTLIAKYIGLVTKRIVSNIHQHKDIRIIKQHKDFEADDTQKYDLSVADGLCEVGLDAIQTWVLSKKDKHSQYAGLGTAIAGVL